MYNTVGQRLHAGSLRQLLSSKRNYSIDEAADWFLRLGELLKQHAVFVPEVKAVLLSALKVENTQRAQSAWLRGIEYREGYARFQLVERY
jgi:hypothetical protein